jgi:DNA-binding beta-propeller fold protein YncE
MGGNRKDATSPPKLPQPQQSGKFVFYFQCRAVYTERVISRRAVLALPLFAACGRRRGGPGFRGYAFIANEEGQALAVIDMEALAVARHIPIAGSPTSVAAGTHRPFVYVLTAANGTVHEVAVDKLQFTRKLPVASSAVGMQMAPDDSALYVLAREPKALLRIALDTWKTEWRIPLPEEPVDFAFASDNMTAAITFHGGVRMVDLAARKLREPAGTGDFGTVKFLSDAKTLIAADRGERRLSFFDVPTSGLITHLPIAVRPDNLCFNADGGQLFVTGEGMDAVVVVYPFHTPEVAETVLASHEPGPLAASRAFLFVASPGSGGVSILEINSRKVIAVASVGTDPGFIAVTPDDQYALVLNRSSGDVAVLRVGAITKNRDRRASLLTVIPVGSRPVSAVVRAV